MARLLPAKFLPAVWVPPVPVRGLRVLIQHCQRLVQFVRLQQHMPKQKAAVAIARKLLVVVWHVLTAPVPYRRADELAVARSLLH